MFLSFVSDSAESEDLADHWVLLISFWLLQKTCWGYLQVFWWDSVRSTADTVMQHTFHLLLCINRKSVMLETYTKFIVWQFIKRSFVVRVPVSALYFLVVSLFAFKSLCVTFLIPTNQERGTLGTPSWLTFGLYSCWLVVALNQSAMRLWKEKELHWNTQRSSYTAL